MINFKKEIQNDREYITEITDEYSLRVLNMSKSDVMIEARLVVLKKKTIKKN